MHKRCPLQKKWGVCYKCKEAECVVRVKLRKLGWEGFLRTVFPEIPPFQYKVAKRIRHRKDDDEDI